MKKSLETKSETVFLAGMARKFFGALAALALMMPASAMAQTSIDVPLVTGDQLIFFFDARENRQTFISVANPSSEAVDIQIDFYGSSMESLGSQSNTLVAAGNVIIDPSATSATSGNYGVALVTPVAGGAAVVPPAPLTGTFTLANLSLESGFGQNPMGRMAVDSTGELAPVGAAVDGASYSYQTISPDVLSIPVYYNPNSGGEGSGNAIILVAFDDSYEGGFSITSRSLTPITAFFNNQGVEVAVSEFGVDGVYLGDLEGTAGAALTSSGKVFFDVDSLGGNVFGLYNQSLQTYSAGQRLVSVPAIPTGGGDSNLVNCDSGSVMVSENVSSNQTWPANCDIFLNGTIFVNPGVTLSIQAGATIYGMKNPTNPPPSALVFRRDSQINAIGTPQQPIVFSSDQPAGSRAPGDWAGLAINGRAPVNCPSGECIAEGLENTVFGGNDPMDSSGTARYLRIEFAGDELAPDNELNVFTLNGVGAGTQIDHIHAHMGLDDGIEWFGVTIVTHHMISTGAADDLFDWQIGYTGALQYGYGRQFDGNIDSDGSRGFEGDNNENGYDFQPRSDAKFCNVTLMGTQGQAGDTDNRAMVLRRGTAFKIAQTLAYNWNDDGFQIRDDETINTACNATPASAPYAELTGDSYIAASGFWLIGDDLWSDRSPEAPNCTIDQFGSSMVADLGLVWGQVAGEVVVAGVTTSDTMADPGIDANCQLAGFNCDPVPANAAAVASDFNCSEIDPQFEDNNYMGAFAPGAPSWAEAPWVQYAVD